MEIKTTVLPKGSTSTLVKARVGYEGGTTEIAAVAEYFGQTFTQLTLHGHSGIEMEAEPLISRIMAKSDFPYVVYLVDSDGMAANSIGDMTLSISKSDEPEAEIGTSRTTTEIVEIDAGIIRKGTSMSLLQATSKGKGSSVVTVEGSVKDISLSSEETITMNAQVPERLEFFIPKTILATHLKTLQYIKNDAGLTNAR